MSCYDVGDEVRLSAVFMDIDGNDQDPTAVYLWYEDPSGNEVTLTYGVDVALVKDAVGQYHADIDVDEVGRWPYRWYSTGTGRAAATGRLVVRSNAR